MANLAQTDIGLALRATRRFVTRPDVMRVFLAGPVALIGAVVLMAAMPLWLPRGAGGIDNLILPILLLPGLWALLFFHALMARNVRQALWLQLTVILANGIAAFVTATGGS